MILRIPNLRDRNLGELFLSRSTQLIFPAILLLFTCFQTSCVFKGEINQKEFASFLTEMDTRRDYSVTHAASQVKLLAAALEHESATVRFNSAQDLRGMGDISLPAVPQLILTLNDRNRSVAAMSYRALKAISLEKSSVTDQLKAEQILMEELKSPSLTVSSQGRILKLLGRLPEVGSGRYDAVRSSLKSTSPKIRKQAIRVLSSSEEDIEERLLADLEDSSPRIRGGVAQVLGRRKNIKAIIPLRQQLSDPVASARWGAAIGLANLKDRVSSAKVVGQLKLSYEAGNQRKECRALLISLGEAAYLNALKSQKIAQASERRKAQKMSKKKNVRKAVVVVRKKLESLRKSKVKSKKNEQQARREVLRTRVVLRGNNVSEKRHAVYALKRLSPFFGSAESTLLSALNNSSPVIRAEAARAVGELRLPRAVDTLAIHAMEDKDPDVRKYAAGALRAIDSATARAAVQRLPDDLGKDAVPKPSEDSSSLMRCSELVALCRLALQELGDLGTVLDSNAGQCAWEIQAGC
jgi:HEAT repeat protein